MTTIDTINGHVQVYATALLVAVLPTMSVAQADEGVSVRSGRSMMRISTATGHRRG